MRTELQEELRAELPRDLRRAEEEREPRPETIKAFRSFATISNRLFPLSLLSLRVQMEAHPELVQHSGLLCMMVVHRETHNSHSSRCWRRTEVHGESDATGCESERSGITAWITYLIQWMLH